MPKTKPRRKTFLLQYSLWLSFLFASFAMANPGPKVRTTAYGGDRYVSLSGMGNFYGMRSHPTFGKTIPLRSKWSNIEFEENSRRFKYNGMQMWLHAGIKKLRHRWSIVETDMATVIDPLLRPNLYLKGRGHRVVVLDPGHGGRDRGASGWRSIEEKRVVLDVARRARVMLANAGFKVYLTREGDRYLGLEERCSRAGRWGADIFISIHMNASKTAGPAGVETYVLTAPGYSSTNTSRPERRKKISYKGNSHDGPNAILGYYLQRGLLEKLNAADRGVRRARFAVLKSAPCPAALVEGGFVSNRREAEKMLTRQYREQIARGIAKGVEDYADAIRRAELTAP